METNIHELLNDVHYENNINTGYIYTALCSNWDAYPAEIFKETEWKLETILWRKKIYTVPYREEMKDYLKANFVNWRKYKNLSKEPNEPPYIDYFIHEDSKGYNLISFNENCILTLDEDGEFDYFFMLKLIVLDLMNVHEFLDYQRAANFNNDLKKYKIFLQSLKLKYKNIIDKYPVNEVISSYINVELSDDSIKDTLLKINIANNLILNKTETPLEMDESIKGKKDETSNPNLPTNRQQVLAMYYLLESVDSLESDITNRARFLQFFTGREVNGKSIHNTAAYKAFKSPLIYDKKTKIKDLEKIRPYFVSIGMKTAVDSIDRELNDLSLTSNRKKK